MTRNREYEDWNEKAIIADCLRGLGFGLMALDIMSEKKNHKKYLSMIASFTNHHRYNEVIEILHFNNLI